VPLLGYGENPLHGNHYLTWEKCIAQLKDYQRIMKKIKLFGADISARAC
jgi:hypothetical protein